MTEVSDFNIDHQHTVLVKIDFIGGETMQLDFHRVDKTLQTELEPRSNTTT